jgi:hypothetical protein
VASIPVDGLEGDIDELPTGGAARREIEPIRREVGTVIRSPVGVKGDDVCKVPLSRIVISTK